MLGSVGGMSGALVETEARRYIFSGALTHEDSEMSLAGSLLGDLSTHVHTSTCTLSVSFRDTPFCFHHKGDGVRCCDQLATQRFTLCLVLDKSHFLDALGDSKQPLTVLQPDLLGEKKIKTSGQH